MPDPHPPTPADLAFLTTDQEAVFNFQINGGELLRIAVTKDQLANMLVDGGTWLLLRGGAGG